MYRGFSFDIDFNDVSWYNQSFYDVGDSIYSVHKSRARRGLARYLTENGVIDGAKMQSEWFPLVKADVFISHSHADTEKAICLSGYLKRVFNLESFVDSSIWHNADDLLKEIDDKECRKKGSKSYDYRKRNKSTSHVHMMLSAALLKMIDKTECFFFLKTTNSLSATTEKIVSETESPWLYAEILFSSLVRKKTLAQHRPSVEMAKGFSSSEVLNESIFNIRHKVHTGHLTELSEVGLHLWELEYDHSLSPKYPLDGLYSLFKQ